MQSGIAAPELSTIVPSTRPAPREAWLKAKLAKNNVQIAREKKSLKRRCSRFTGVPHNFDNVSSGHLVWPDCVTARTYEYKPSSLDSKNKGYPSGHSAEEQNVPNKKRQAST
jgi:hypothetical protein